MPASWLRWQPEIVATRPPTQQKTPMFEFPDPLGVAEGTYLIRPLVWPAGSPSGIHVNSLVIEGTEPVIVDTGAALFRDEWADQVFGLVEPADVRWIFLSHDDPDHTGNLSLALDMCPAATVVTSWFAHQRMIGGHIVPPDRQRWIGDGEHFDTTDRRLVAVRPPVFDAPTTRGLYDTSTRVYWSSDAFGAPVTDVVDSVADLAPDDWDMASTTFSSLLSPWHTVADPVRFGCWVDRVAGLHPAAIVSAHGPVILEPLVDVALERMRRLPGTPAAVHPGQDVLDELIAMLVA
jgi:flavorubredoxin